MMSGIKRGCCSLCGHAGFKEKNWAEAEAVEGLLICLQFGFQGTDSSYNHFYHSIFTRNLLPKYYQVQDPLL